MTRVTNDVWQAQASLGRRLLSWSGLSVAAGAVMGLSADRFWRGVGSQFVGWGLIDAGIAWLGLRSARSKAAQSDAHTPARQLEMRTTLHRVLWINAALDVGYVTGGVVLATTKGRNDSLWRGIGWGIVVQGGFLLIFDLVHALLLGAGAPRPPDRQSVREVTQ